MTAKDEDHDKLDFNESDIDLEGGRTMRLFAFSLDSLIGGDSSRARGRLIARTMLDMIENDINTRLEAASVYPYVFAQNVIDFDTDDEIEVGAIGIFSSGEEQVTVDQWKTALTYARAVVEKASCFTYEHMFRSFGERSGAINLGSQWKQVLAQDSDITVRADVNELPRETNLLAVRLANFLLAHDYLFQSKDERASHARFSFNRLVRCRTLTKADLITSFSYAYERHAESPIEGADSDYLGTLLVFFAEEWPIRATQELLAVYINHARANGIDIDLSRQAEYEMSEQGKYDKRLEMMESMLSSQRDEGMTHD